MKISSLRLLPCLLLLMAASGFCATHTYTWIDIGVPAGDGFTVPRAINASAQITGAAGPSGGGSSDVFV